MLNTQYDVAVIGGGPAGYVAAIKAAMLNGKVILFEKSVVGGTCLNRGCIPTKSYIKTAETIHNIQQAGNRGIIHNPNVNVDMGKVVEYKNGIVKKLTGGVAGLLKSHGIQTVYGEAVLSDEHTICCNETKYTAKNILLCGGSTVGKLNLEGCDCKGVLSSDEMLELKTIPKRLLIIGGGVIGCEIATAYSAFGSLVTVVEATDSLIPMMDKEVSEVIKNSLTKDGVKILLSETVDKISRVNNELKVTLKSMEINCDVVLVSVGRKSNLSCLGELKDKITLNNGYVVVDEFMRTNINNIYAPGDINGKSMLAHSAFKMGEISAINAMGGKEKCRLDVVPNCVYTIPEVASVGLTQKQGEEKYGKENIAVGRFPFSANGRALASGEEQGFIKVIIEKDYGELIGVHMAGANVTELIANATSLMASEVTAHEIIETIYPHPTLSEAFMEGCADALGKCIHLPKK